MVLVSQPDSIVAWGLLPFEKPPVVFEVFHLKVDEVYLDSRNKFCTNINIQGAH